MDPEQLQHYGQRYTSSLFAGASNFSCWKWTGPVNGSGTPVMIIENRETLTIDFAYYLQNRKWPEERLVRRCENPLCVRVLHFDLEPGAPRRGRRPRLGKAQRARLQALWADGWTQDELVVEFEVSQATVSRIIRKGG